MKLISKVGIWKIVVHIAFKFYSVAAGFFYTLNVLGERRGSFSSRVFSTQ